MSATDVKCPICGTVNRSLDLEETDGWMECEHCGNTVQLIRKIQMPDFLADEMKDYFDSIYALSPDQRIFPLSKSYMHHEMTRGSNLAGVKRIRIHDLRHSHVSLLIELGFGAVAIERAIDHADEVIRRKKSALKAFETSELNHAYQEVEKELADNSERLAEANKLANKVFSDASGKGIVGQTNRY